jgi:hypothetical protein
MNFIDALNEAKRKALLSGQPLTPQEIEGMSSGWFNAAAANSGNVRSAKLAEDKLAQDRFETQQQIDTAKKAETNQLIGNVGNTAVTGLGMNYMTAKPGESLIAKGGDMVKGGIGDVINGQNPFATTPSLAEPLSNFATQGGSLTPALGAETGVGVGELAANGGLITAGEEGGKLLAEEGLKTVGQEGLKELGSFATRGGTEALTESVASSVAPSVGLGTIASAAMPYAAIGNFIDRALVRPFLVKGDKTLQVIEDIFNPIGGVSDLVGTFVCTELYRQGYFGEEIFRADAKFGAQMDKIEYSWYKTWGVPLAARMAQSKLLSRIVSWFMKPVSLYMASQMGVGNGSLFGKLNFKILQLVCKWRMK